uniref:Uncharacterized protein n=1 Tax=Anguilla anguilla TaxID=7936 RepID=A0A0E9U052_ANGAN
MLWLLMIREQCLSALEVVAEKKLEDLSADGPDCVLNYLRAE